MEAPFQLTDASEGDTAESAVVTIVADVEGYERAANGAEIKAIRAGRGSGSIDMRTTRTENCNAISVSLPFPMMSSTVIDADSVGIRAVRSIAPQGSRWCETDLEPEMVAVYRPNTEHFEINDAGLDFSFVTVDLSRIEETAEHLELIFRLPPTGESCILAPSSHVSAVGSAVNSFTDSEPGSVAAQKAKDDDLLHRVSLALSDKPSKDGTGMSRSVDNIHVVTTCTEYADSIQRVPSIPDLCLVAHVSERRLRTAFHEAAGMPPSRFFRMWGLNAAHRILLGADKRSPTVTQVAADLGFWHFGRFAGRYKDLFGESPSETRVAVVDGPVRALNEEVVKAGIGLPPPDASD